MIFAESRCIESDLSVCGNPVMRTDLVRYFPVLSKKYVTLGSSGGHNRTIVPECPAEDVPALPGSGQKIIDLCGIFFRHANIILRKRILRILLDHLKAQRAVPCLNIRLPFSLNELLRHPVIRDDNARCREMKIITGMPETNRPCVSHAVFPAVRESPDLLHFAVSREIPADIFRRPRILFSVIGKEKNFIPLNRQDAKSRIYYFF